MTTGAFDTLAATPPSRRRARASDLPFFIVVASAFMPVVGSAVQIWLYNLPLALVVLSFAVLLMTRQRLRWYHDRTSLFTAGFLSVALVVHLLRGNGYILLSLGGYLVIFTLAFLLLWGRDAANLDRLVAQLSTLYKIYLVALVVELVLVMAGAQPLLASALRGAPAYKDYNPADVLRLIRPSVGGLNSLILGSQGAGLVALSALIWFLNPTSIVSKGLDRRTARAWAAVAGGLLVVTYTQTIVALFLIAAFFLAYVVTASRYRRRSFRLLLVPALLAAIVLARTFLFGRVLRQGQLDIAGVATGMTRLDYYFIAFASPILQWYHLDMPDRLWGAAYKFQTLEFADSGLFATMYLAGLLWLVVLTLFVVITTFRTLRLRTAQGRPDQAHPARLAATTGLIGLLWYCSVFHYIPAFLLAGVELFAFHLALAIYSWHVVRDDGGRSVVVPAPEG